LEIGIIIIEIFRRFQCIRELEYLSHNSNHPHPRYVHNCLQVVRGLLHIECQIFFLVSEDIWPIQLLPIGKNPRNRLT
jgi:hypothetical protein